MAEKEKEQKPAAQPSQPTSQQGSQSVDITNELRIVQDSVDKTKQIEKTGKQILNG